MGIICFWSKPCVWNLVWVSSGLFEQWRKWMLHDMLYLAKGGYRQTYKLFYLLDKRNCNSLIFFVYNKEVPSSGRSLNLFFGQSWILRRINIGRRNIFQVLDYKRRYSFSGKCSMQFITDRISPRIPISVVCLDNIG